MPRKIAIITMSALLIALVSGIVYAAQPISIMINGKVIESDTPAQIINDRTMVPIRVIAEGLGADVSWDAASSCVKITGQKSYKLIKLNGQQTTWPYWYIKGRVYMEQRNLIELLHLKYQMPWYSVLYSSGNQSIYINALVVKVEPLEQDGFTIIPLDCLKGRNALAYEFDPDTGSLTAEINQKY
ncbi:MAG TPA: copper amine oxidase N-terminal domain-containing protein [Syntrophomonadaceae bacterium]|nr:copper amine oxidase N-terminal domain-containing protein [Syntrophomonadaceae bacterium]